LYVESFVAFRVAVFWALSLCFDVVVYQLHPEDGASMVLRNDINLPSLLSIKTQKTSDLNVHRRENFKSRAFHNNVSEREMLSLKDSSSGLYDVVITTYER
jgi:hypothetical protein